MRCAAEGDKLDYINAKVSACGGPLKFCLCFIEKTGNLHACFPQSADEGIHHLPPSEDQKAGNSQNLIFLGDTGELVVVHHRKIEALAVFILQSGENRLDYPAVGTPFGAENGAEIFIALGELLKFFDTLNRLHLY